MNPKGMITLRVSTMYLANTLAALAVLCLIGGGRTIRAQSPPAARVIYNFAPATGFNPGGLTGDSAGNLYAATRSGGSSQKCGGGCGSILKLSKPYGKPTTLYTFTPSDQSGPGPTGLVRDTKGNLYVTTQQGGRNRVGSVIKVTASGAAGTLYSFQGGDDGEMPNGGVAIDSAGNLYGTTAFGGGTSCTSESGNGCGIVFSLTPSGSETVLYRFTGGSDGSIPLAAPTLDSAGNLYGTAAGGGDLSCVLGQGGGCGTVWKLNSSGNFTVLYTFTGDTDGAFPEAGLVLDGLGSLYGDTAVAGDLSCQNGFGCGVVFKIDSSDNFTVLHAFAGGLTDGSTPLAGLTRDSSGNLYGPAQGGGSQSCTGVRGVVFKLDPSNNETILHAFSGGTTDGWGPNSPLITDGNGNLYGTTVFGGLANGGVIFQVQMQ
jgi:uncharacterized repeat protein (TIGR03803 family)